MIKKIVDIKRNTDHDDEVELSWFDMQKSNLTAVTKNEINFVVKVKFTHLHENDILVDENGYAIKVIKSEDEIFVLEFNDALNFAKTAYEIGNRHQPVEIEKNKITVLDDISLQDIIRDCFKNDAIKVEKTQGYFKPNGKAHHSH